MCKIAEIINLNNRLHTSSGHTIDDPYLEQRFKQSVEWYIRTAKQVKFIYFLLSIIGIVVPATIPIINNVLCYSEKTRLIVNCLSFVTSASAALLSLIKAKEKWLHFRCVAELLQSELSLYAEGVGHYRDKSKRNQYFAERIEKIMANENKRWLDIVNDNSNKKTERKKRYRGKP